jgi:threonine dehydratase
MSDGTASQTDVIPVGLEEIRAAERRLGGTTLRTPIIEAPHFSRLCGASVYLKLENLQRTGSFKLRGATNKIAALLEGGGRPRGVVAASAGNHAQGVASAASSQGIPATVVMPQGATLSKIRACREMGAEVVLTEPTLEGAAQLAQRIAAERDYAFLHPYDDWDVIAGQGTLGLELLEDLPDVDVVVTPLGGGGLTGGVALAIKLQRPNVRVIGVQTDAVCPYAGFIQSGIYQEIQPTASTIADGINVKRPGTRNSAVIRQYVDDVATVDDNTISEAIVALLERTRTICEGAGAIGLAALMARKVRLRPQEKVAVVLSGGNIDMTLVGRIIDFGLVSSGRMMTVALTVADAPGRLAHLLSVVAELGMNVRQIAHRRGELHIPVGQSEVVLQVETSDAEHQQELIRRFTAEGLPARVLTG